MSDLREQVIGRLESELATVDAIGATSEAIPPGMIDAAAAPWLALRAIIEAHKCQTKMRMQPGGGEGEVRPCNPKTCPVALAAHHLGIED